MKEIRDNLTLFIHEQKSYFNEVLAPDANGIKWGDAWVFSTANSGFLVGSGAGINFDKIKLNYSKTMLNNDEIYDEKEIVIDPNYADFIQAFLVYKIKLDNSCSPSKLNAIHLLLKRIYVRLLMSGVEISACAISSEILHATSDLLATFRKKTNLVDDQTYLSNIAYILRKKQLTYSEPEFRVTARRTSHHHNIKKARKADFAEDFDDDEDEKLIEIEDFLNVIALRNLVMKDSEKIMLNMTLLLFVAGFRYEELASLAVNALNKLVIEDKEVRKLLNERDLPTYYLGISYQGKKGAGIRTHWVEPLAIRLVEFIFADTIKRTHSLREQVKIHRENNFDTLLPPALLQQHSNAINLCEAELELNDIVSYIYESTSETNKSLADLRRSTYQKLKNAGITPSRIGECQQKRKDKFYTYSQVDEFLKTIIKRTRNFSDDMILRMRDSKNGYVYDIKYEELLFITEVGSTALNRSGKVKPLATPIFMHDFEKYLGMNQNRSRSIFAKYNLKGKDGKYTQLKTHMPRHNKNTFLADVDLEIFEEFSDELAEFKSEEEKKDTISTHSDLAVLSIGSCMRKINIIECPFNMMCQDGEPCPYFTLTGRADEVNKLRDLTKRIQSELTTVNTLILQKKLSKDEADALLNTVDTRKKNIEMLTTQHHSFEDKKVPINLLELDNKKKPIKLATLFAIEHRANEAKNQ